MKTSRHTLFVAFLAGTMLGFSGCGRHEPGRDRPIVSVPDDDAAMSNAIAEARASVGTFIRTFQNPTEGESDFSVKVPVTEGENTEHFWLCDLRYTNGVFVGTIGNDPETVKTVAFGQKYSVKQAEISDWLYLKGKKMVGNRTLKALFPRMPPEEVAAMKKRFEME